jgi:hypothetical protein
MKVDRPHCTVSAPDEAVDAGAAFALQVRVEPAAGDGAHVSIRDAAGKECARAALVQAEGNACETGDIAVAAPAGTGEHVFRAVVLAPGDKRALHEAAVAEFRVAVKAHAAYLNVWDVPSAIPAGGRFAFKVGLACSAGCNLGGQRLRVLDHAGRELCALNTGAECWPDTAALYVAEIDTVAPADAGRHSWQVVATDWATELPHASATLDLSINAVPAPECTLTITVVDYEKRTPIGGATVVLHPFRATTGADGIAKLAVPKGQYDVRVSARRYEPASTTIEASDDIAATLELDADETWKSEDEQFGERGTS